MPLHGPGNNTTTRRNQSRVLKNAGVTTATTKAKKHLVTCTFEPSPEFDEDDHEDIVGNTANMTNVDVNR